MYINQKDMEIYENSLCCGCLCAGRKMVRIVDGMEKQCFSEIIMEIPMVRQPALESVWLCWECEAKLSSFQKFKKKVKYSYKLLHDYKDMNLNIQQIKGTPRLNVGNIYQVDILPTSELIADNMVKLESPLSSPPKSPDINVKNEFEISANNTEEDIVLIEVKSKKKKLKKKRLCKKEKKQQLYIEVLLSEEDIKEERRLLELSDDYVNAMFRCEKCLISFPNADDLKDHISIKHELTASNFKCKICECCFRHEVSYNYHTNKHMRRYQCVECGERLHTKSAALKHHDNTHMPKISFYPENEQEIDKDVKQNIESYSTNTADLFPCQYCEKTFRWKTSLRKHLETHSIEKGQKRKPFCEICRLFFTTTSNLQKHVKRSSKHQIQLKLRKLKEDSNQSQIEEIKCSVMNSREMHACKQCDKKFQWRGNLVRHLQSHASRANGDLVCKPCNRTFSSIATFKQHMQLSKKHVSENDFRYMCSDCGQKFASKIRLKDHIHWEHLKTFLYRCPVCLKVFKSSTSLYLHKQLVHKKDEINHLCDHCGRSFPSQTKLRVHMTAAHTTLARYRCGACPARFRWHSCLSRHVRRMHKHTHKNTHADNNVACD